MARRTKSNARVRFAEADTPRVLPELANGRTDVDSHGAWIVEAGAPARGEAWTNHTRRMMRVPTGDDDTSRAIRMHEMMHAMFSPSSDYSHASLNAWCEAEAEHGGKHSPELVRTVLTACEEVRVNWLAARALGAEFDYASALTDGTEKRSGADVARGGETYDAFVSCITFGVALLGTKAFAQYTGAVRKAVPAWADVLGEIRKLHAKQAKRWVRYYAGGKNCHVSGTSPTRVYAASYGAVYVPTSECETYPDYVTPVERGDGTQVIPAALPIGFANCSIELAQQILRLIPEAPAKRQESRQEREVNVQNGNGVWRDLIMGETFLTETVRGASIARKTRYAESGTQLRSVTRWTTDPQRRAFGRTVRTGSAVIVFDVSGSMSLTDADIDALTEAAPNCTVLAYASGRSETTPNAHIIAKQGKRTRIASVDRAHGNGNDGTALTWGALEAKRQGNGTPLIWVTDGGVTGAEHTQTQEVLADAARLVKQYRPVILPDAQTAVRALRSPSTMRQLARVNDRDLARLIPRALGGDA